MRVVLDNLEKSELERAETVLRAVSIPFETQQFGQKFTLLLLNDSDVASANDYLSKADIKRRELNLVLRSQPREGIMNSIDLPNPRGKISPQSVSISQSRSGRSNRSQEWEGSKKFRFINHFLRWFIFLPILIILLALFNAGREGAGIFWLFIIVTAALSALHHIRRFISVDLSQNLVVISGYFTTQEFPISGIRKAKVNERRGMRWVSPLRNADGYITDPGHYKEYHLVTVEMLVGSEWITIEGLSFKNARNFVQLVEDVR